MDYRNIRPGPDGVCGVLEKDGGGPADGAEVAPGHPRVGRPPHQPTEEQRRHVENMAALWLNQEDIAAVLGIGVTTLRKHYPEELRRGTARGNLRLTERFRDKLEAGDTASIIWATKCRLGWSEKLQHQHSGPAGAPISVYHTMSAHYERGRPRKEDRRAEGSAGGHRVSA